MTKKAEQPSGEDKKQIEQVNLDDLKYNEIQEVCDKFTLPKTGTREYLINALRVHFQKIGVKELPPVKKTEHENLDSLKEEQVLKLAE